jgi:L-asparaginase
VKQDKIHFIITGGTIDDLDYDSEENAPKDHQSLIPSLLSQSRITANYNFEVLMQKDSRVVSDEDRERVLKRCREVEETRIVITHGTFTMPETASYLGKAELDKTIVLFGAAVPANKEGSDALFNLGAALVAVQLLQKGVYVVMNGKVFEWAHVKKDFSTGTFQEK